MDFVDVEMASEDGDNRPKWFPFVSYFTAGVVVQLFPHVKHVMRVLSQTTSTA